MMKNLRGNVVVVTGASSGLGRATAVEFAKRGCTLVLAARREEALEETARLCRAAGGEALSVVTDVTSEADVHGLAATTLARFGRVDVWVNNAGVTLFGFLEDGPFEQHRRVIETNLFGSMHGARAAVPIFRKQGQGVLINVGSVLSKIGQAFVPSYVISKFALRGLSEALRVELADEPGIHVCSIYPYAIDTPHFQEGANLVGRDSRAMAPMQSPERVARAIVSLAARPRRERHVPRSAVLGLALHKVMPRTVELILLRALRKWHLGNTPEPAKLGNLYAPGEDAPTVHGKRPPLVSTPHLFAWAARQFATLLLRSSGGRRLGA